MDCVFWQSLRGASDGPRRERWARDTEESFGPFGRIVHDADRVRGVLHYGPATLFPRASALPAGPPHLRAALLTCVMVEGEDPVGTCERLLLEALADLKARGLPAVEAFAVHHDPDVGLAERVLAHHTLFDRGMLTRLGFLPVREQGRVALMRLPLGGLVETPARALLDRARTLMERLAPQQETAPSA
jgi:hypothetical protein